MKKQIFTLLFTAAMISAPLHAQNGKSPNFNNNQVEMEIHYKNDVSFPTTSWLDNSDTSWYNSSATSFNIKSAAQLAGLAKLVFEGNDFAGKTISLTEDVDVGQHLWAPIGYGYQKPFSGTFVGNKHTVKNVKINRTSNGDFVGLFGQAFKATIKDLTADHVTIRAKDTAGGFVGNLSTNSKVVNCHIKNLDIIASGYNVGGFAGSVLTDSSVDSSSSSGRVEAENQVGGFVGSVWDLSLITNSYAEGKVIGGYILGGFVGFSTFAFMPNRMNTIKDSYAMVDVEARLERAGGFAGMPQHSITIENSYAVGEVKSPMSGGAFAGMVGLMNVKNTHYNKEVSSIDPIGAFEGGEQEMDIKGQLTSVMKSESFVTSLNASNPDKPWIIVANANNGYPVLKSNTKLNTNELTKTPKISLYPTVSRDFITISSDEAFNGYSIYDMTGRLMNQNQMKTTETKISISHLTNGTYLIHLNTSEGNKTLKFIKK